VRKCRAGEHLIQRYDTTTSRALTFTWDQRNRLTDIRENDGFEVFFDLAYEYDTFNRTKSITTTVGGGEGNDTQTTTTTTSEKFVYDGQDVVLDFYKPDGGSYTLAHRYLYGPGIDQILAQENVAPEGVAVSISAAGRVYWMLTDNLGTVRDLLDANGNLVEHYRYDAFGAMHAARWPYNSTIAALARGVISDDDRQPPMTHSPIQTFAVT